MMMMYGREATKVKR